MSSTAAATSRPRTIWWGRRRSAEVGDDEFVAPRECSWRRASSDADSYDQRNFRGFGGCHAAWIPVLEVGAAGVVRPGVGAPRRGGRRRIPTALEQLRSARLAQVFNGRTSLARGSSPLRQEQSSLQSRSFVRPCRRADPVPNDDSPQPGRRGCDRLAPVAVSDARPHRRLCSACACRIRQPASAK